MSSPEYHRDYYERNKDKKLEQARRWQESNKDHRKEYMRKYYAANKSEKWTGRTDDEKAKYNATRRTNYAASPELRESVKAKVKEWQSANPAKLKTNRLKQYGIGLTEYNAMLAAQGGKCGICGYSDMSKPAFFPLVDHCHATGAVRGLLCMSCNQGLGKFRDDRALLAKAMQYIAAGLDK